MESLSLDNISFKLKFTIRFKSLQSATQRYKDSKAF